VYVPTAESIEPMKVRRTKGQKDEAPLSPEQIAYREAQDRAATRVRFFGHCVVWAMVTLFLIITAGFGEAMIVAFGWGIFLARQGYKAIIAPELERRFLEEELGWRMRRLAEQKKVVENRTSRSLEELSASIAHEIRNPITAAKSLVQQMGEDPASVENVEYAKIALEELDRVERSISHLLRYAREEAMEQQDLVLTEIVDSALESFRDRLAKSGVKVERDHDGSGAMRGDPEKLRRVVINLVGNALDALEEAKTPDAKIVLSSGQNLAGSEVWLKVKDNGPGIPEDKIAKIWSPFFTSKAKGTGLGLAITKKLIEAHGGTIEVSSETQLGTEFTIVFSKSEAQR
jgi:signal transduction histidine kinase